METERQFIINLLEREKESFKYYWFVLNNHKVSPKDVKLSKEARMEGNELYSKRNHDSKTHEEIFKFYCKSIALAPNGSEELALAYGNRSAFLQHVNEHKDCIQDIDRALNLTSSVKLKVKLLCRKAECFQKLGLSEYHYALESAKVLVDKSQEGNKSLLYDHINKTQNLINKLSQDTKAKMEKSSSSKALDKIEATTIFDSVNISYTEKYGRHLVATRDFCPGEIIFVEKLYTSCLSPNKMYTHCYHCLNKALSSIPCEYCNWVMFCSEKCKQEAAEKYHDLECLVMFHLRVLISDSSDHISNAHLCIRMFIIGLKEYGSLDKMKSDLEFIDQHKDTCYEGLKSGKEFCTNSFRWFYNFYNKTTNSNDPLNIYKTSSSVAIHILILFAKYTEVFDKNFKITKVEDLMNKEEALFLGSLLFKLHQIRLKCSFSLMTKIRNQCINYKNPHECSKNLCCMRGMCISSIATLLNHSCFPNVSRVFTDDQKIIIYALQPVKKNSQLFDSYGPLFKLCTLFERKEMLSQYDFICDCLPCKENWPKTVSVTQTEKRFIKNNLEIFSWNFTNITPLKKTEFTEKDLQNLSNIIVRAFKCLSLPSEALCHLLRTLENAIETKFSYKEKQFEKCEKP